MSDRPTFSAVNSASTRVTVRTRAEADLTHVVAPDTMPPAVVPVSLRHRVADYVELVKARLTFLVMFTVVVGFLVGSAGAASIALMGWTVLGVLLVTASGAILNQYIERGLDRRMHRTQHRPLAAGRISALEAASVGVVCGVVGLAILTTLVNPLTAGLALAAWVVYVAIYTPLKTRTPKNTLVGAVAGALPPMMGWAGATGSLDTGAWLLFAMQFVWQIPHFLAIAWLYREDYARGGFRMLSVGDTDGRRTMFQIRLFSMVLVPLSIIPAIIGLTGSAYLIAATLLGAAFVACALRTARSKTLDSARSLFLVSILYLPALFAVMTIDRFIPA